MTTPLRDFGKLIVRRYPAASRPMWRLLYPLFRKSERWSGSEYTDRQSAFDTIFRDNRWQSTESVSGPGSTLDRTVMLQSVLKRAIDRTGATTILDAPCGDFNWMQHIEFPPGTRYIGGDIVAELAVSLQEQYGSGHRAFQHLDIAADPVPAADLWLCRHVLFHLSNDDIRSVFRNFVKSKVRFILTENFDFVRTNEDIRSGGFRFFNLRRAPFGLPHSIANYPNSNPPEPPDYLNLWSREQIAEVVRVWDQDEALTSTAATTWPR